jgi:hypothetical protein
MIDMATLLGFNNTGKFSRVKAEFDLDLTFACLASWREEKDEPDRCSLAQIRQRTDQPRAEAQSMS